MLDCLEAVLSNAAKKQRELAGCKTMLRGMQNACENALRGDDWSSGSSRDYETELATCKTLANSDSAKRGRAAVGRRETLALDPKSARPPSQQ